MDIMDTGIHMLEVAAGIKDSLINAGFTVHSLLNSSPAEIAAILGIEIYVGKIIFDAARKAAEQDVMQNGSIIADNATTITY